MHTYTTHTHACITCINTHIHIHIRIHTCMHIHKHIHKAKFRERRPRDSHQMQGLIPAWIQRMLACFGFPSFAPKSDESKLSPADSTGEPMPRSSATSSSLSRATSRPLSWFKFACFSPQNDSFSVENLSHAREHLTSLAPNIESGGESGYASLTSADQPSLETLSLKKNESADDAVSGCVCMDCLDVHTYIHTYWHT